MPLETILSLLAAVFDTTYTSALCWYGGHGNEITALAQDRNQPDFLLINTTNGWYIAHKNPHFGCPSFQATLRLARGLDPREVCYGY